MKQIFFLLGLIVSFAIQAQHLIGMHFRSGFIQDSITEFRVTIYSNIPNDTVYPPGFSEALLNFGNATGAYMEMLDSTTTDGILVRNYLITTQYRISIDKTILAAEAITLGHRIAGIRNIIDSERYRIYCRDSFLLYHFHKNTNSGATISAFPLHLTKTNKDFIFNPSATDADGDSLSYSLMSCWVPNYYLPSNANLDPLTGTFTFSPDTPGIYAFNMQINEWRKDSNGVYYFVATSQLDFIIENPMNTSLNELEHVKSDFILYPNPAKDELTISSNVLDNENANIEIFNSLGQTVYHSTYSDKINVTELSNGMYNFVLFRKNHTIESLRFIKD